MVFLDHCHCREVGVYVKLYRVTLGLLPCGGDVSVLIYPGFVARKLLVRNCVMTRNQNFLGSCHRVNLSVRIDQTRLTGFDLTRSSTDHPALRHHKHVTLWITHI